MIQLHSTMLIYGSAVIYKPTSPSTEGPFQNYGHGDAPITSCRRILALFPPLLCPRRRCFIAARYQHHFSLNFPGICFCCTHFYLTFSTINTAATLTPPSWGRTYYKEEVFPRSFVHYQTLNLTQMGKTLFHAKHFFKSRNLSS